MSLILNEMFLNFIQNVDLDTVSRQDWQRVAYGADRIVAQQLLIKLSEVGEDCGTIKDSVNILKAAHAVLPLYGNNLKKLVKALTLEHPLSIEWTDVLIKFIFCNKDDNSMKIQILECLKVSVMNVLMNNRIDDISMADTIRIRNIINSLRSLNYGNLLWLNEVEYTLSGYSKEHFLKLIIGCVKCIIEKKQLNYIILTGDLIYEM